MKPSDELKNLYPIYSGKNAQTVGEICRESGLGETSVRRHADKMVKSGKWKKVLIREGGAIKNAYIAVT